jgi:hypothetical protein
MSTYPKHRKPSGYAICTICGKTFTSMGMGAHRRQAHQLVRIAMPDCLSNDHIALANVKSNTVACPFTKDNAIVKTPLLQHVSDISCRDLTECNHSGGQHLYTVTDLNILMGRICQIVLNTDISNLIGKWETDNIVNQMITDFERRFECRFNDVKEANPDVRPGKSDAENWVIASKYASLQYSR